MAREFRMWCSPETMDSFASENLSKFMHAQWRPRSGSDEPDQTRELGDTVIFRECLPGGFVGRELRTSVTGFFHTDSVPFYILEVAKPPV